MICIMTCSVSLSVGKILEKHVRSSSYLLSVFFKEIHFHMENLLNGYFYYSSFISDFLSKYFQELLFLAGERKINKIYQRKLKLADKLWSLEIAYLKLCICRQLFCIRQTSQFSQFYRVLPAELCALLINVFEKLHLINSEANLQSPQHLNRSFLWHKLLPLTTVTRRSIIDAAGVLDTPLKLVAIKSFKRNNRKIMSKATNLVKQFFRVQLSRVQFSGGWGQFPWRHISRGYFFRGNLLGGFFHGGIFSDTSFKWLTFSIKTCLIKF